MKPFLCQAIITHLNELQLETNVPATGFILHSLCQCLTPADFASVSIILPVVPSLLMASADRAKHVDVSSNHYEQQLISMIHLMQLVNACGNKIDWNEHVYVWFHFVFYNHLEYSNATTILD